MSMRTMSVLKVCTGVCVVVDEERKLCLSKGKRRVMTSEALEQYSSNFIHLRQARAKPYQAAIFTTPLARHSKSITVDSRDRVGRIERRATSLAYDARLIVDNSILEYRCIHRLKLPHKRHLEAFVDLHLPRSRHLTSRNRSTSWNPAIKPPLMPNSMQ
jgi:hypothetical protein